MNKIRIIGAIVLCIGIAAHFLVERGAHDFWIGAAMGVGIVLLVTGRIKFS